MLRWTDRLKNALRTAGVAGIDFPIRDLDPDMDDEMKEEFREIREAEFVPPCVPSKRVMHSKKRLKASDDTTEDSAGASNVAPEFPPEFSWDDLEDLLLLADFLHNPLEVVRHGEREQGPETRPCPFDSHCVDILWLSSDEFISLCEIIPDCHHYSIEMQPIADPLYVYQRATFETFSYEEESAKGPTPMTAFRFIGQLFAPFEEDISACLCNFNARHIESITPAMYSSLFSIASDLSSDCVLYFKLSGNLFRDPLNELRVVQFHPSVQLTIEPNYEFEQGVTNEEVMDILRDLPHLAVWCVGDLPCAVASSLVESLRLIRHNDGHGWPQSVDEVSRNQIVKKLLIDFHNSKSLDDAVTLLKCVLAGHKSLEHLCMTVESMVDLENDFVDSFAGTISKTLSTLPNGLHVGLSHFSLIYIFRTSWACGVIRPCYLKIKCNAYWDNMISPWLVHNWFHTIPKEPPRSKIRASLPAELLGVATQALNQGVAYAETSNLIPHDLSASSWTILFCLLRRNVDPLVEE
jgi:hypothetical protein